MTITQGDGDNNAIGFIVSIDNHIYDLIKSYQVSCYSLSKLPKDDFIALYQKYGIHKINFDKIFN